MSKTALCLNMIVKNEMANLKRCLASVAQWISCWVMCDTGWTDGAQGDILLTDGDMELRVNEPLAFEALMARSTRCCRRRGFPTGIRVSSGRTPRHHIAA